MKIRKENMLLLVLVTQVFPSQAVKTVSGVDKPHLTQTSVQCLYGQLDEAIAQYNRAENLCQEQSSDAYPDSMPVIRIMNILGPLAVYCRCSEPESERFAFCKRRGRCNESEAPPVLFRLLRKGNASLVAAVLDALSPACWGDSQELDGWCAATAGNAATLYRPVWPWRSLVRLAVSNTPVLQLLLERGVARCAKDSLFVADALCDAVATGQADSVRLLLESRAVPLNVCPVWASRGETLLLCAARRRCKKVLPILLASSQVDLTVRMADGCLPEDALYLCGWVRDAIRIERERRRQCAEEEGRE